MMLANFQNLRNLLLLLLALSTVDAKANMVGTTTQNFNVTPSSEDYVTVYSSQTLGQGKFSLGLFVDSAANTLPHFKKGSSESSRTGYRDLVVSSSTSIGYGLSEDIDLGVVLPAVLFQQVKSTEETHGEYSGNGITELRIGSKIRFFKSGPLGFASVVSSNFNLIRDNPYDASYKHPTLNLEMVADVDLGMMSLASNLGYRFRTGRAADQTDDEGNVEVEGYQNQMIASVAAGIPVSVLRGKFIAEIYTGAPSNKELDQSQRHTTRAEALAGLKINQSDVFVYHIGAGTELRHSVSSPDWRVYAGMSYNFGVAKSVAVEPTVVVSQPALDFVPDFEESDVEPIEFVKENKPDQVLVLQDVLFKMNSTTIADRDGVDAYLKELVSSLRDRGFDALVIEGHTCSIGSDKYNLKLSQKRAQKIKKILVERYHFSGKRIITRGLGERKPVASNKTEYGREQNRRVEFKIYRNHKLVRN